MLKPENCGEFDNYDFPYDPARTEFLAEGEENELTKKAIENVKKLKAEQDGRKTQRAFSASPKVSFMDARR
ncbi:MAG: hypothetical protein NC078_01165 [Ruminococcus sp.]|nr:hypothetical protein [Ruminococcus sp.]